MKIEGDPINTQHAQHQWRLTNVLLSLDELDDVPLGKHAGAVSSKYLEHTTAEIDKVQLRGKSRTWVLV